MTRYLYTNLAARRYGTKPVTQPCGQSATLHRLPQSSPLGRGPGTECGQSSKAPKKWIRSAS